MATATEVLRQEHQSIRAMPDFTAGVADKMSRGEPASPEALAKVMDFIRLFVDQCHHSKEEDIFFPVLEKKGIHTFDGLLGVMLMEHDRGRTLIHEMSEVAEAFGAGSQGSGGQWSRTAWDYSDLMYDHFGREEEVLFRMADNVLSPDEQTAAAGAFELLEKEKIGPGRREQLQAMMKDRRCGASRWRRFNRSGDHGPAVQVKSVCIQCTTDGGPYSLTAITDLLILWFYLSEPPNRVNHPVGPPQACDPQVGFHVRGLYGSRINPGCRRT